MKNYAELGHQRITEAPIADIESVKLLEPQNLLSLGVVVDRFGLVTNALFIKNAVPDWLSSGYRTTGRQYSAHKFCQAFDVKVGGIIKQLTFVKLAIQELKLFNRGGVYHNYTSCHIDNCGINWMAKHNGAKFWFADKNNKYHYFMLYEDLENHIKNVVNVINN